mgnify:FL=1
MRIHRLFWSAMQGAGYAFLFLGFCAFFAYLLAPSSSPANICAKTNERGSSAWVACVDRMIQERK